MNPTLSGSAALIEGPSHNFCWIRGSNEFDIHISVHLVVCIDAPPNRGLLFRRVTNTRGNWYTVANNSYGIRDLDWSHFERELAGIQYRTPSTADVVLGTALPVKSPRTTRNPEDPGFDLFPQHNLDPSSPKNATCWCGKIRGLVGIAPKRPPETMQTVLVAWVLSHSRGTLLCLLYPHTTD